MDIFINWLKSELERTGKNQSELARHLGVQPSDVNKTLGGKRALKLDEYAAAVTFFQTPTELRPTPLPTDIRRVEEDVDDKNGYSREHYRPKIAGAVPELDVFAGAGEGAVGDFVQISMGGESYSGHRVVAEWNFPTGYLRNFIKVSPKDTIIIEVRGDSMDPTLRHGDKVIVDLSVRSLGEDGMYLISDGAMAPKVKRLEYIFRSDPPQTKIISDNPSHRDDQTIELSDLIILGRIAGRLTAQ